MSAVEVTITGMLYDRINRTTQNVVLIGEASLTGLGIGGGPVLPPGNGGKPPGFWGPTDPRPTPPIYIPPGGGIPTEPPPDGGDKPPPTEGGGWGFVAEWSRWGYFPAADQAAPKG